MGKTFKDRARWERKNDRFKESAPRQRFDDRSYREKTNPTTRQVQTSGSSTANTAA